MKTHEEKGSVVIRKADERGHSDFGWLDSRHTFSFGEYYDPRHKGFRSLRVINEDRVQGGQGFGSHPHRDMEIISYVLAGAMEHKDSLGTGSIIRPGDVQRMSAGTGVTHSEFNHSATEPVHFLQIWILPEKNGLKPGYEQKNFPDAGKPGPLKLIGSHDGREGSVTIHQDVNLYSGLLDKGQKVSHSIAPGRHGWVQVVKGLITVNGTSLGAGDGAALSEVTDLHFHAPEPAEFLMFDLA